MAKCRDFCIVLQTEHMALFFGIWGFPAVMTAPTKSRIEPSRAEKVLEENDLVPLIKSDPDQALASYT